MERGDLTFSVLFGDFGRRSRVKNGLNNGVGACLGPIGQLPVANVAPLFCMPVAYILVE